jgi:hypothetical protein
MLRKLLVLPVALGALVMLCGPASAGFGPPELEGTVSCADGTYTIDWTLTVFGVPEGASATVDSAMLSGATAGSVDFEPNPIPGGVDPSQTATGATVLPGTTTGDVTLDVDTTYGSTLTASATVTLDGTCTQGASSTTTASSSTTTTSVPPAVAAAVTAATPTFTG